MMAKSETSRTIIVLGAGVIGLSCAVKLLTFLLENNLTSSYQLLLVSREWPTSIPGAPPSHSPDYASMWAGAHVRPIPASSPQLKREARWLKQTVSEFDNLLNDNKSSNKQQQQQQPTLGLTRCMGVEYLEAPPVDYQQQTAESFYSETGLPGYRKYGPSELPDEHVRLGYEYETYCVNSPLYCGDLLRKFILQGGKTMHRDLRTEWEAFVLRPNVQFVINASGMGFRDLKCYPTRGQTAITNLTAATKTVTRQHKDGNWSFIIPRFFNGGTIFGGTKEAGNWQSEPSVVTRNRLIKNGRRLIPEATDGRLADQQQKYEDEGQSSLRVITDVVGRRPTREGGMRIEVEEKQWTGPDGQLRNGPVLHAYGAGGRGYEISWGVANEVVEMCKPLMGLAASRPRL